MRKSSYKVVNIVASVNLKDKIDLYRIARKYKDISWNPERFPGLIMRISKPKSCILVFHTGKMVVTGLSKENAVQDVVNDVIKKIRGAGVEIKSEPIIKIQNVVASGDIGSDINLDLVSILLKRSIYEPEVFPGLIYRMNEPKAAFLIFSSGKIVVAGAKNEEIIKEGIKKLRTQLKELDLIEEKKD
ncbi:MAG: TATA-box-binding protein [Candidatus Helarchaeota archaeon]